LRDTNGHRVGLAYSLADAKLWASAPDLLAACEWAHEFCLHNDFHGYDEMRERMICAIAKAREG